MFFEPDQGAVVAVATFKPKVVLGQNLIVIAPINLIYPGGGKIVLEKNFGHHSVGPNRTGRFFQQDFLAGRYFFKRRTGDAGEPKLEAFATGDYQVQIGVFEDGEMDGPIGGFRRLVSKVLL